MTSPERSGSPVGGLDAQAPSKRTTVIVTKGGHRKLNLWQTEQDVLVFNPFMISSKPRMAELYRSSSALQGGLVSVVSHSRT